VADIGKEGVAQRAPCRDGRRKKGSLSNLNLNSGNARIKEKRSRNQQATVKIAWGAREKGKGGKTAAWQKGSDREKTKKEILIHGRDRA